MLVYPWSHFNSIKVQLELSLCRYLLFVLGFQFHKGTIRTRWAYSLSFHLIYFNSIKVQLERVVLASTTADSKFQFHKGTIRTR